MKIKLTFYLFKSFVRERKLLISLMFLCLVSTFVIISFAYMTDVSNDMIRQTTEKDCGKMDVWIYYEDLLVRSKAVAHENVSEYYEYYSHSIYNENLDNWYVFEYCDEEYLQYSSFHCIEGYFPQKDNEVLCEPWYLRSLGIVSEDMMGSKISIGGNEYVVSGLIVDRGYSEKDIRDAVFLCKAKPMQINNYIMIDLDCDLTEELRNEFYKYTFNSEKINYISINADKMRTIDDMEETTYLSSGFVFVVLLLSTMIILSNYILLFINHTGNNINNYIRQGLPKGSVFGALSWSLCSIIIIFNNISGAIYLAFSKYLYTYVIQKNKENYEYTVTSAISEKMIIIFIGITVIEIVLVLVVLIKLFFSKSCRMTGKIGKVYNINPKKYNSNRFFWSMSKNNLRMSKGNNILMIAALSIGISAYVSSVYFIDTLLQTGINYGDTTYILKFSEEYRLEEEEVIAKQQLIDDILDDERFGGMVQNIYYTMSNISKDKISDKCIEYLEMYYTYNAIIGNQLTTDIPLYMAIVSSEYVDMDCDVMLEDYEGVFYNTSTCYSIPDSLDIHKGDKVYVEMYDDKEVALDIVAVEDEPPLDIYSDEMSWVIVVNDKTFRSISNNQKPSRVYLTENISEQALIDYLKDVDFVQIERVDYDNQTVNDSTEEIQEILYILLCLSVAVLLMSLAVSCNTRIKVFKKEYKTLYSVGIPIGSIIRIPIYEMMIMAVPIIVCSIIGSYIVTSFVYQLETVKILYVFPMDIWLSTVIMLLGVMIICVLFNVRTIMKIREG